MEDLASWKELYNDTHILFRTKEEDKEKLYEKIKYQHPKARTEDIVEIKKNLANIISSHPMDMKIYY